MGNKTLVIVDTSADTVYVKRGIEDDLKNYAVAVIRNIVAGEDDAEYLEMFVRNQEMLERPPSDIEWEQLAGCLLDLALLYLADGDTPVIKPETMIGRDLPAAPAFRAHPAPVFDGVTVQQLNLFSERGAGDE